MAWITTPTTPRPQRGTKTARWAMLLAFAGFTLAGCGALIESATENAIEEAVERAAESESGEDVEIDFDLSDDNATFTVETDEGTVVINGDDGGGSMTIEGEDGENGTFVFGAGAEQPDCVPEPLRVPDDYAGVTSMSGDGLCMFTAYAPDGGSVDDLADRYEDRLRAAGYDQSPSRSTFEANGMMSVSLAGQNASSEFASINLVFNPQYYDPQGNELEATVISVSVGS